MNQEDKFIPPRHPDSRFIPGLKKIHSAAEYAALPSGAHYEAANGTRGIKP